MTLRQRLPRVGSRLLRRLAAGEVAVAPAGVCIAAPATVRALSSVAGRALAGAALLGRGAAHNASALPQHSALLSLAAMRQFAAAADLPAHQVRGCVRHMWVLRRAAGQRGWTGRPQSCRTAGLMHAGTLHSDNICKCSASVGPWCAEAPTREDWGRIGEDERSKSGLRACASQPGVITPAASSASPSAGACHAGAVPHHESGQHREWGRGACSARGALWGGGGRGGMTGRALEVEARWGGVRKGGTRAAGASDPWRALNAVDSSALPDHPSPSPVA